MGSNERRPDQARALIHLDADLRPFLRTVCAEAAEGRSGIIHDRLKTAGLCTCDPHPAAVAMNRTLDSFIPFMLEHGDRLAKQYREDCLKYPMTFTWFA